MDFTRMHNDYLDPDQDVNQPANLPKRYEVRRTDYKWQPCWGVFDTQTSCWIMRDTVKRHCTAKAKELNQKAG